MKTKAAVLYEQNKPLVIEEIEVPSLGNGQVLVKILYTGICRTQVNEMRGVKGPDKFLPHCMGHEASGIIEEVGPKVIKVKKGDYVVLTWIKGSGKDVPSCQYSLGEKKINSGAITTFNKYSVVSENRVVKISKEVPHDIVALLGCAVPTGAGMVKNTLKTTPENSLAVFGVGGVGLSAILYANSINCSKIIAIDINENKLELAKECGATHTINAQKEDALTKIKELTDNQGVEQAIESSGVKDVMETAFEALRKGGTMVLAGNVKKGEKIAIDPYGLINGKKILGTWGGETNTDEDLPFYARQYLNGTLKLEKLITHRYTLEDINRAFEEIEKGNVGRALIKVN